MVLVVTVKVVAVMNTTMRDANIIMKMVAVADIAIKGKEVKSKKIKSEHVRTDIQTDYVWRESW